jgi:hypothetical protein
MTNTFHQLYETSKWGSLKNNITSTNNGSEKQAKKKICQVHGSWNTALWSLIKYKEKRTGFFACKYNMFGYHLILEAHQHHLRAVCMQTEPSKYWSSMQTEQGVHDKPMMVITVS